MAVYKIFPEKSATLYSSNPLKNTGLDEILEINKNDNNISRSLIKFSQQEINETINNISGSYETYLKLFLANSYVPLDYTIYCYPIYSSWSRGTGKYDYIPSKSDGVSWTYSYPNLWDLTSSLYPNVTSSYPSNNPGGGNWWSNLESTQSFKFNWESDININVTNIINEYVNENIDNEGFILKLDSEIENNLIEEIKLMFFSSNTHTIYPPCLEIKWDDSSYLSQLNVINSSDFIITLDTNGIYSENSINKIRINVRDKYPVRIFQTSSLYLNNKILPSSSYWAIKDLDTEEIIIDFDSNYTKLSADNISNYFILYSNGLQPERYYKILIKTIINNEIIITENNDNIFKIIR